MVGSLTIGVLAVQGDFAEHAAMLRRAARDRQRDIVVREVRTPRDLIDLDGHVRIGRNTTRHPSGARAVCEDGVADEPVALGKHVRERRVVGREPANDLVLEERADRVMVSRTNRADMRR